MIMRWKKRTTAGFCGINPNGSGMPMLWALFFLVKFDKFKLRFKLEPARPTGTSDESTVVFILKIKRFRKILKVLKFIPLKFFSQSTGENGKLLVALEYILNLRRLTERSHWRARSEPITGWRQ